MQPVGSGTAPLTAVPRLDDLARNPSLAENLAPSTVASLLGRARIATSALEARIGIQKPTLTNQEPPPARLMTAATVADRLGFTQAHIYELARAGKIKSLRQGKYVRFAEAALLEYIASIGSPADTELLVKAGRGAGRKN